MIYLAGPFFNDDQKATQSFIENKCNELKIHAYSPRLKPNNQILEIKNEADRMWVAKNIFEKDIMAMNACNFGICNIDDRDTGTAFEMGYFCSRGTPFVTYSAHNYGCNVMLAQAGLCHLSNLEKLEEFLKRLSKVKSYDKVTLNELIKSMKNDLHDELTCFPTT